VELRTVGTLLALLLFGAETVDAQDRRIYGTRAFGMGGASVAVVQDATAVGVNPAAMGFLPATDFQFPVASVDAEIRGDILRVADDIADVISEVPILEIIDAMSNATTAEARQAARQLGLGLFLYDVSRLDSQGKGAKARGVTGPAYRFKNFGFALTGAIDATVGFELDLKSVPHWQFLR
jgi:hypothetical protein